MPTVPTRPPIRRLDSIAKSTLGRPRPLQRPAPAKRATCCDKPQIVEEDGLQVCSNCGTQISEANIVADVTFQEDSRGAATVQGGFVGGNARYSRTMPPGVLQKLGGGDRNSAQEIEKNGRRALEALCPGLSVPANVQQQAAAIWGLAAKHNFTAGRRTEEVIAACLYAACRRQKENTILLMDISEIQHVNVFRLGEVYKDLVKELYLGGDEVGVQHLVEVEPLIMKYCRKLEFGEATRQVAEDAIKIIRRMKRDWMVTGRHPAGLCGACIILAARMNNFRRSVREVVFVAKVAEMTVRTRIEEFRRTKSATLTVGQFREYGVRLKQQNDPPSLNIAALREQQLEARKRKRQRQNEQRGTIEISDDESETSSRAPSATPGLATPAPTQEDDRRKRRRTEAPQQSPTQPQQERRWDADGFEIPAIPVDPAILDADGEPVMTKRKPGRPKKNAPRPPPPPPPQISEDELIGEAQLEKEIEEEIVDEELLDARNEIERAKFEEHAKLIADQQKQATAERTRARREAEGVNWWKDMEGVSGEQVTAEELEAEFANDPEVMNCELSEVEAKIKEQIWVAHNEDWLRSQKEKELQDAIAKANGTHNKNKSGGAKRGTKKKRSRMGDGTVLTEHGTPIETPADANAAMVAKRAPAAFSKYVNYEALAKVYGHSTSTSTSASRAGSEAPTDNGSRAGTPSTSRAPSASPAPRRTVTFQSPPATQATIAASRALPATPRRVQPQAPVTPEPTQEAQATVGAEAEAEDDQDEEVEDYVSEVHSQDGGGWDIHDDDDGREDIGEEDYGRAMSTLGPTSLGGRLAYDDEEDLI